MQNLELKHLRVLAAIYQTQSITQTAAHLGLSQPSISVALATLRKYFNDQLFVRTANGMKPTPHTEQLMKSLDGVLDQLDAALGSEVKFDPAQSDRIFRICMVDLATVVILPPLLEYFQTHAPHVALEVMPLSDNSSAMLENGEADVAIGVSPPLETGFYQKRLYEETLICIARTGHPRVRDRMTADEYLAERHIIISPPGTSHWLLEKALNEQGMKRRVGSRMQSYLGVADVIATTDLIATVPRNLANHFTATGRIRIAEAPPGFPSYVMRQYWHERYQRAPYNIWLRNVITHLFAGDSGGPAAHPY